MKQLAVRRLALLLLVVTMGGCAARKTVQPAGEQSVIFTDALGREVQVSEPARVGAVMGSLAELWTLAGGTLAAVTEDAVSERDLALPEGTAQLGSLKNPSAEAILAADLDLLLLSADIAGHLELEQTLSSAGLTLAYLSVETFEDYLDALRLLTQITGRSDLYETYGTQVQQQVQAAIDRCTQLTEQPTVLLLRAYSTGVKAKGSDNMTGEMLADLGCINIADSETSLLEDLSLERILEADPDYIFITTMGSSDEDAMQSLADNLTSNPAWQTLTAVQEGRVHVLQKELFHYKPNARWGESYEILADLLGAP